ncbi:hypothetical protein BGW80DRAFT_1560463 [Lactifluus volemus]|nr:hypothetical protein BGW80DRAFT_1560463 [Lactifluus volemus]
MFFVSPSMSEREHHNAFFRRAQVWAALKKLDEAHIDLQRAVRIEPNNETINAELARVDGLIVGDKGKTRSAFIEIRTRLFEVYADDDVFAFSIETLSHVDVLLLESLTELTVAELSSSSSSSHARHASTIRTLLNAAATLAFSSRRRRSPASSTKAEPTNKNDILNTISSLSSNPVTDSFGKMAAPAFDSGNLHRIWVLEQALSLQPERKPDHLRERVVWLHDMEEQ